MPMRLRSTILLHRSRHIQNGCRRQTGRETRAAFLLWMCVLTMTNNGMDGSCMQWRVKQATGASDVSHASASPVSTVIQMCCANIKNYHIFSPPLFLQGRPTSYSKYVSIDKQSRADKSLFRSFPHSFQGTDPPCLESFRSTSRMDLEQENTRSREEKRRERCHPLLLW